MSSPSSSSSSHESQTYALCCILRRTQIDDTVLNIGHRGGINPEISAPTKQEPRKLHRKRIIKRHRDGFDNQHIRKNVHPNAAIFAAQLYVPENMTHDRTQHFRVIGIIIYNTPGHVERVSTTFIAVLRTTTHCRECVCCMCNSHMHTTASSAATSLCVQYGHVRMCMLYVMD